MKTQIWWAARKTFFYSNIPLHPAPVIALARSVQDINKVSPSQNWGTKDLNSERVCTYSFPPRYFWDDDPACRAPFKRGIFFARFSLMPVVALGILTAKETRHINNECLQSCFLDTDFRTHSDNWKKPRTRSELCIRCLGLESVSL